MNDYLLEMYEVIQRLKFFYPLTDIYRMQNNKVKNIFFIEDNTENYKTGLYLEMEDWRKFAHCSTDFSVPFKLIQYIPQQKSSPSSEDKPIANEQDFWIDDTRLKKIIEATWYCIKEYWYINDLVCLENVKKHLD